MFRVSNPKPCSCERKGSWIILMKGKTWQCNWHIFTGENNGLFLCFADPVAAVKPNRVLRELPTIGVRVKKQKKTMDVLTCKDFLTKIWAISLCFWALQNEGEEEALWWHAHLEIKMQFACSVWCTWSSLTTLQGSVWGASTDLCHLWVLSTRATAREFGVRTSPAHTGAQGGIFPFQQDKLMGFLDM